MSMSTLPTDPDDTVAGDMTVMLYTIITVCCLLCSSSHNNNTLNLVASLLTGHAEAGVPHPALPAVADVPGGAQATGAVSILVIAEITQPRPRA